MVGVFFEFIFSGRGIFMTLLGLIAGLIAGGSGVGRIGRAVCLMVLIVIQFIIFSSGEFADTLAWITHTGVAPGFNADGMLLMVLAFYVALSMAAISFGYKAQAFHRADQKRKSEALSVAEIVNMLNVLAGHPQLAAAGWLAQRWAHLDASDRQKWAGVHLAELRDLWLRGGDSGFEGHGLNLPMLLAAIDK